ncbi:MAG: DNA translocase FtsK 4TM domain-containing protein, partial [Bacteroidales bacterium]
MAKNVYVKHTEPQTPVNTDLDIPAKKAKEKRVGTPKTRDYTSMPSSSAKEKWAYLLGVFLLFLSLFLLISFVSHLFVWYKDFDKLSLLNPSAVLTDTHVLVKNATGRLGAYISFFLLNQGFGISSFLFVSLFLIMGLRLLNLRSKPLLKVFLCHSFFLIWISLFLGSLFHSSYLSILGGAFGYELSLYLEGLAGMPGLYLILLFSLACFAVFVYNFKWKMYPAFLKKKKTDIPSTQTSNIAEETTIGDLLASEAPLVPPTSTEDTEDDNFLTPFASQSNPLKNKRIEIKNEEVISVPEEFKKTEELSTISSSIQEVAFSTTHKEKETKVQDDILFTIENAEVSLPEPNKTATDFTSEKLHFGIDTPYDPALDLKGYKFPTLDLLVDFGDTSKQSTVQNEELLTNKNRIIETLKNYSIEISQIKATIGPTVTLYEIIPAPGVRISKIKNLEDDIALSLSALGIRIIAPIPGKGTIGIEVPNQNKQVVPMRVMLESDKFKNGKFDLPIALGKTISNECFVTDLTKMPHLLMAGATGQGKSVGLNAIIGSLLYKKHPSELKFILVDPKKVELSLFNKIERHYLAKLPDSEEAIITDTRKVVRTLTSLCIEMDQRYDLL